ncbi:tyrosine-protein phosphatase non-receptor type 23 isoform X3 [Bacillus rossius redtenbacheri]|uniref:tyrosine-protein phosphatase non-receptor type 23 isoform X3 n=1 Tax=Bacillus rossius redtenbacheri TaxID=93214 RepID=UPI002FDD273E
MEAVPRLPMVHFELKVSPEAPSFGPKLKQYIRDFYHEDPESYGSEIRVLEGLRASAVSAARNATLASCSALKQYYCQLHFLQSRFPMGKDGAAAVAFTWRDAYASMVCTVPDIAFEMVCILYNIGAVHSYAGASESRDTADGMKLACTHFQCAAWAFQHLKDSYAQPSGVDLAPDIMQFMYQLMLAQAQECILEKSMMDNRKATIIAKVAVQVVDYYKLALNTLEQGGSEDCSIAETVGSKLFKGWKRYVRFKLSYHGCVSLLYQGQQAEEQQKMGERVALYQAASEKLEEAVKLSKGMDSIEVINEALTFTMDVVEGKKKAAKNENEFIYHEEVPDRDSLPEVKGASLVRGIQFDVNDPEVSGADIFGRLVPMKAHEQSSLYSEEKAKLLRGVGARVEEKDQELVTFMTSLQLEHLDLRADMERLPQELVDRCAALSAKPSAIQDLIDAMGRLADTYQDVESMLQEIRELLELEEAREKQYQALMGPRPPSIVATDLTREARKYEEAHAKASDSNQTLHKAMTLNISNLRVLALPLPELERQIPSLGALEGAVDDPASREMRRLVRKVDEMRSQRSSLLSQLRDAVCRDDITKQLVTRAQEPADTIFAQELEKHQPTVSLIEKNLSAQDNILKALTDVYAKYAGTRKATNEIIRKREATINGLISSYDAYEDLLAKSSKGVEFYRKLETNVSKLLQRVKGTCKVQDEEREHILAKNNKSLPSRRPTDDTALISEPASTSSGAPKLKDYLQSMKRGSYSGGTGSYLNPGYGGHIPPSVSPQPVGSGSVESVGSQQWIPSVRPAPVGSEGPNSTLKSAGYAPESKAPPPSYTHPGSFHASYSQNEYASSLPYVDAAALKNYYNSAYQQPQQYSYDLSSQAFTHQLSDNSQAYGSVPQVPSSYTHAVTSSSIPTITSAASYTPYQPAASSQHALGVGYADPAGSQAGTLYYPSQYAASYTSLQQAPVSYPCTPSQQPGSVYCMTGQLGSRYPATTSASSTPDLGQPRDNRGQAYGYDGAGYLPPSGVTDYQYMSSDPNTSCYTSAGTCDTSQTCSSNKSVDGQTYAAQYNTSARPDTSPGQSHYYSASYGSYQYGSTVGQEPVYYGQQQTPQVDQQQATYGQQPGYYGQQQTAAVVDPQQAFYSQQPAASSQSQPAVVQQPGYYGQQQTAAVIDPQQALYSQQPAASSQSQPAVVQQPGYYGQQQTAAVIDPQQALYSQQPAASSQSQPAVIQQPGYYGQQQTAAVIDPQQALYSQQPAASSQSQPAVVQQPGYYGQQQTAAVIDPQQALYSQQPAASSQSQSAVGQQPGYYGQQQTAAVIDPQQALYSQQPAASSQSQPAVGQQPGYYGQQQTTAVVDPQQALYSQQPAASSQSQPGYYGQQQTAAVVDQQQAGAASNVDLLAGLDFTVSQAPLEPQQPAEERKAAVAVSPSKQSAASLPESPPAVQPAPRSETPVVAEAGDEARAGSKGPCKDPYSDPDSLAQFVQEVEKYEKFVDSLVTRTLNGPTPLDMKWKELLDLQEREAHKHSISVARCYPMKNRFPDILPYDDSRVELPSTKDDYINASYVKDVVPLAPPFIVTQAPLPSTYSDFWTMVWEQQVEVVVCLLSSAENQCDSSVVCAGQLEEQVYWPADRADDLVLGKLRLSLQSSNVRPHWTERILSLAVGETRVSRVVVHLQFTAWPGSSFPASPGPFLGLVSEALAFQQQQRAAGHPVLVHCLSGVGRTGLFLLLAAAVGEVQAGRGLPDLVPTAALLSSRRKNLLRDREHLRFAYQALLYYAQDMLMKRGILTSRSTFEDKRGRGGKSHTRHPSEDFLLGPPTDLSQLQSGVEKMGLGAGSSSEGAPAPADPPPGRWLNRDAPLDDPFADIDPLWPLRRP